MPTLARWGHCKLRSQLVIFRIACCKISICIPSPGALVYIKCILRVCRLALRTLHLIVSAPSCWCACSNGFLIPKGMKACFQRRSRQYQRTICLVTYLEAVAAREAINFAIHLQDINLQDHHVLFQHSIGRTTFPSSKQAPLTGSFKPISAMDSARALTLSGSEQGCTVLLSAGRSYGEQKAAVANTKQTTSTV